MTRNRHPNKDVEAAVRHAESHGWSVKMGGSHAWGRMLCPANSKQCRCGEFCISCIWSTPKNSGNHALSLRRVVDNCTTVVADRGATPVLQPRLPLKAE